MRFLELNLLAFGPFTNVMLDFARGDAGLHLVYGPNEAGKSSALRAIHAGLFGISHQCTDNFIHDHKSLRIGVSLQNSEGHELTFVRRKGRKDTMLNVDPDLGPFPDTALSSFLGPVDAETFDSVFAIGHGELRQGGEQMRTLKGLCGESLYAAALGNRVKGGTGLAEVLHSLDLDAANLFSPKKTNSLIKVAKKEYELATKEKRSAQISVTQWNKTQDELQRAVDDLGQVRQRSTDRSKLVSRLKRLRDALRPLGERQRLLAELAELGEVNVLPDSYSSDERAKYQADLESTQRRISVLTEELNGESGLTTQIAAITIPQELIENEQLVAVLQEHLGAYLKAATDRSSKLQPRRAESLAQIVTLRRTLGLTDSDNLETLRITADRRVGIQNLANDEKRLRTRPDDLAAKLDELQHELRSNQAEQSRLGNPRDLSDLRRAMEEVRRHGDLEQQLDMQRQSLLELQKGSEDQLAVINLWNGSLKQLACLPLPMKETVDRFELQFSENRDLQNAAKAKYNDLSIELGQLCEEIAILKTTDHIPTDEELCALRDERQHGWNLVRKVWLEGCPADAAVVLEFAGDSELASAYEQSVTRADELADRMRREADRVARLATQMQRKSQIEKILQALKTQLIEIEQDRQRLLHTWSDLWGKAGITAPLPPREMRIWLDRHTELKTLARDIEQLTRQLATSEQKHAASRARMLASLKALGVNDGDNLSLNELLDRSESLVEQQRETNARRAELEVESVRLQREIKKVVNQKELAELELSKWLSSWRLAMSEIGCPEHAPAEQANERLNRLEELFQKLDDLERIDVRIRDIESDAILFEREVGELVARTAPDLAATPAVQAATQLRSRLDTARNNKTRHDQLVQRAAESQAELQHLLQQRDQLSQRLQQLCHVAGAEAVEQLSEIEHASRQVTRRRDRLQELNEQLFELAGGASIDQLAVEAEKYDVDGLTAEIADLEAELEDLGLQREQHAARVRELEQARDALSGSGEAAAADERSLGILARMHSDAERYLQLRLAAAMLRHQIDRFREENQDPLLSRASLLFSRLTCHEFAGLRTEYAENDQPVIIGVRQNDQLVPVEGMSDGTRDQLYFALRMAYLERRLTQHEPMPFIVDDVLINFDNVRAQATLELLAELSRQTQVIFFTHHQHLVEIAESLLTNDLFVHQLGDGEVSPDRRTSGEQRAARSETIRSGV